MKFAFLQQPISDMIVFIEISACVSGGFWCPEFQYAVHFILTLISTFGMKKWNDFNCSRTLRKVNGS